MQRKIIISLSVACLLLATLSCYLAFRLFSQSRFIATQSTNPYIMFDKKTAQACWSGPASNPVDKALTEMPPKDPYKQYGGSVAPDTLPKDFVLDSRTNSVNLPFCKDLK